MKMGHEFSEEHGFTGSAHEGKNFRPKVKGFKHGGEEHAEGAKDHHGKTHKDHDGEMHQSKVHYDKDGYQHHKMGGSCK